MGRPPINISVLVSSTQDSRFVRPLRFYSIRRLSEDTGISLRAIRNAYHSGKTSNKKSFWRSLCSSVGETIDSYRYTSKCYYCHNALTVKDRSTWFHMERKDTNQVPMTFTSLYVASKVTGISNIGSIGMTSRSFQTQPRLMYVSFCVRVGQIITMKLKWFLYSFSSRLRAKCILPTPVGATNNAVCGSFMNILVT